MSSPSSSTAKTTAEWAEEYDKKKAEVTRLERLVMEARLESEFARRAWRQSKWSDMKAAARVGDIGDVPEMQSPERMEKEDEKLRKRQPTETVSRKSRPDLGGQMPGGPAPSGPGICEACAIETRNGSKKATGHPHTREPGCRLNGVPQTAGRRPKRLMEPPSEVPNPATNDTEANEIGDETMAEAAAKRSKTSPGVGDDVD